MTEPKILAADGMNLLHRARSGFTLGDHYVAFNFFRQFRALVEAHQPTRVYFCLEGRPKHRYEMLPDYKANRTVDPADEEAVKQRDDFFRQANEVVGILRVSFPVSVVQHPDFEGDDVVYNLIKKSSTAVPWVVASNDSDFTQLLEQFEHVKLYNPMTKAFVEAPDRSYVVWKALRGDGSDNIKGLVSDERASELVADPQLFNDFIAESEERAAAWLKNFELISFRAWTDEEALQMTSSAPARDWDSVKRTFDEFGFKSMLKDRAWDKFVSTFDPLFG